MGTTKAAKASTSAPKKEKVFHPESRKANQIARKALRKGKMGNLAVKRSKKQNVMRAWCGSNCWGGCRLT